MNNMKLGQIILDSNLQKCELFLEFLELKVEHRT